MVQVIQHKRRIGAGATGGPGTLAAGELAYNSNGKALFVGDDGTGTVVQLVGVERQLEIHTGSPVQTVQGGAKSFSAAAVAPTLKITGGNPGEFLSTTNVDGTLAFAPMISASQQFVGSADGSDGSVTLTVAAGGGAVLPAAAPANNGWYVIYDVAGTVKPPASGATVVGPFEIGDWLISNGAAWTHLAYGGISSVTAADVGVAPTILGGDDVQEVLTTMAGLYVTGPALSATDNIATYSDITGQVIKDSATKITDLATTLYVDGQDDAQDLLIAANAAAITALQAYDVTQDGIIAGKGDVSSTLPVTATHIATFLDVGGKMIVDGGIATADIALKSDLTGLGDVVGTGPTTPDHIATYSSNTGLLIKDGGILSTDLVVQADIAAMGDVIGPNGATADGIAVYDLATGKLIKDSTRTIAALDATIATKVDITTQTTRDAGQDAAIALKGDVSSTGPAWAVNNLAAFSTTAGKTIVDSGQSILSIQTYVDDAINNIPGATPPEVFEPDLTGDGTALLPITWTGVKFDPLAPANIPPAFTGVGTTASPLALVLVDGGTY